MDVKQIKVGDKVRIKDHGGVYISYEEWASHYGLTKYQNGKNTRGNSTYVVDVMAPHMVLEERMLVGISNKKNTYIVDLSAIELVEEVPTEVESQVVAPTEGGVETTKTMGANDIIGQDHNKKILKVAIADNLPTLIIGETGTGKTTIIREQAFASGRDIIRFSITGETTVDEFVGKYELEAGKTVWRDGVLLDAMRNGKWLVADEVNAALPEILFVLHSLLDDDKMVTVTQHGGEVVKPHENFRFFATMNPTDEYAGTKELNKAFQSRFNIVLKMAYPDPRTEANIVTGKAGVPVGDAVKMADVAAAIRKAKSNDKIFYTCSTRDLIHWGSLTKHLSPKEAFVVSILNKCAGDEDEVKKIFETVIGQHIKLEESDPALTIDWITKEHAALKKARKDFENSKDKIREEITQNIVKQLTTAGVPSSASKPEVVPSTEGKDSDIFGDI